MTINETTTTNIFTSIPASAGETSSQEEGCGITRIYTESWRPALTPEQITKGRLTLGKDMMKFSLVKGASLAPFFVNGEDPYTQKQLGRALALRWAYTFVCELNGWYVMSHKYEDRMIFVTVQSGEFFKAASVWEAKIGSDGFWMFSEHPMSLSSIRIVDTGSAYDVQGDTFALKEAIKAAGGKPVYTTAGKFYAWRFADVNAIPAVVRIAARMVWYTKYHFLAKFLMGDKIALRIGEEDRGEILDVISDAKRRQIWAIAGYDWRDFPVTAREVK